VPVRNLPEYRDAAVVLIDQLKGIYVDSDLEAIETVHGLPKPARKDYQIGLVYNPCGIDDPDQ
jgi:peptide/nickel transport system substrate-binding protein